MELFRANNIVKQYANHLALNNVSISVKKQSIYGILGPNGAGKTSLLRIINQITAPDSGELFFKGERLSPIHVPFIGYLPEERGLYRKMKVGEHALYLAQLKGLSKAEANAKLKLWFEKFEITSWWNRRVEELSKGMQQKVQFIVTILHDPELLIFDEPFSGFDPINANLIKEEMLRLRDNGTTIILSTHNMDSVEELCDEITLLNKSQTILSGSVKSIRNDYKNNLFKIEFAGNYDELKSNLGKKFTIKNHKVIDGIAEIIIQSVESNAYNQLLGSILPYGQVMGFQEILPDMNEIFIQKVQNA